MAGWAARAAAGLALLGMAVTGAWAAPDTPVIVVPGVVGSKLCEAPRPGQTTGPIVWGGGIGSLRRLRELDLPLTADAPERLAIQPCGLLEKFSIVGPFGVDVYSGLTDFLRQAGYAQERDLFIFDYDWRRSNFDSAARLKTLVAQVKAKTGKPKVHLVAHSMGGIVSRIYLQALGGSADVDAMIFLGVPHKGAAQVMKTADKGWGFIPDAIAGGDDVIRTTLFSWPSVYELIPLEACCAGPGGSLPLTQVRNWAKLRWLPAKFRANSGLAFLERMIAAEARVRAVMDAALPQGPRYEFIVARAHDTTERAVFTADFTGVQRFLNGQGDEAVPVLSAANGDVAAAKVVQQKHASLFDDLFAQFTMAKAMRLSMPDLERRFARSGPRTLRFDQYADPSEVCEGLPPEKLDRNNPGSVQAILLDDAGETVCIWAFRMEMGDRNIAAGSAYTVRLTLGGFKPGFARALTPTLRHVDEDGVKGPEIAPSSAALSNLDGQFAVTYVFSMVAPAKAAVYRLDASQDGLADKSASLYMLVYGPSQ